MPESPDLFAEVAILRDQVEDMSRTVSAIARRSGAREEILDAMQKDRLLAEIFLLVDGERTQTDIVQELGKQGRPATQPTVSRKLDSLMLDYDLVRKKSRNREGTCYIHTSLATDLKIARSLTQKGSGSQAKSQASAKQGRQAVTDS